MGVTYSAIADSAIDGESEVYDSIMEPLRDNPIASHKYVRRSGDHAGVTNSTALVDDGTLEFACEAGQTYVVYAVIDFTYTHSTAGARVSLDGPAGITISAAHIGRARTGVTWTVGYFTTTDDDPSYIWVGGGGGPYSATTEINAIIVVGSTAGTVKVRYAQYTAMAGETTTLKTGSYLVYHRVDSM